MPDPTPRHGRASLPLLIWAVAATVADLALGITVLLLMVQLRKADAHCAATEARLAEAEAQLAQLAHRTTPAANPPVPSNRRKPRPDSPFATLQESAVAGRYHLFQEGLDVGIVTLLPNHSMINKDGTTFPQYHWEIQPDGLMTRWQAGRIFFDGMPKPGVYVMNGKDGNESRRLEKVEE